jgi:hypothetical protein
VKISRFSEIDLARFIALADDLSLEPSMESYRAKGGSTWNYDPVRGQAGDLVGAATPLYGPLAPVPWESIDAQIMRACKYGDEQRTANSLVGRALYDGVRERSWSAVDFAMGRMLIGSGEYVRYWSDVVLADNRGTFVPFFDYRRRVGAASERVAKVVFSMQQVWIRDRYPDLANSRLAIVRFANSPTRSLEVSFHDDQGTLFTFDELDQRVRTVYETWERVLRKSMPAKRRTGTDGTLDFFEA